MVLWHFFIEGSIAMYEILSMDGPEVAPLSGGTPKQLVVFLHGVGADGTDLIGLAEEFSEILPDAHFLSPHAPFYCDMAPMGRQWFSLADRDMAHMVTGINACKPLLNNYIDGALARFRLTMSDLIIIGFSQGTMMALHTFLTRAQPCAGIIGYSGAIISSAEFVKEITAHPPVCLVHGEQDDVVPFAAMVDAEATLLKADIDVEAHPQRGMGHTINAQGIDAACMFLQKVLLLQGA
ncbi:MAG: phospholipase [Alphaproteobacteria bacterium]|nr:MAG: phospholipase [Alphaproteobacteria bacterium]TAF16010.1 MAG: phospholipase [Alphaproteobacteria bacterium]TAF76217.1 MAG: phospholipase [Alphaproteobacteria bacterium]